MAVKSEGIVFLVKLLFLRHKVLFDMNARYVQINFQIVGYVVNIGSCVMNNISKTSGMAAFGFVT